MGWILLVALLLVLFWPERGVFIRWRRARRLNSRQVIEDALMHVHHRQHNGRPASIESLSAALGIPTGGILKLVQRMEAQALLVMTGEGLRLTGGGHRWALQVVRAHRLFERYLADETGVPMQEVHGRAHRLEHTVSAAELNKLDADLGHPAFDAHGDPIPNEAGQLQNVSSQSLVDWPVNRAAQIVHVEDEPPEVYAQIVAEGLSPGMIVTPIESDATRLVIESDGMEHVLAPAIAANISVREAPAEDHAPRGRRLSTLTMGERARVVGIDPTCRGLTRRRFLDLGLTPGARVEAVMQSVFRNPAAYRVRNTLIALRRDQADLVWIEDEKRACSAG